GWQHADDLPGKAASYQRTDEGGRLWEILVPLRNDVADYAARMGDAVSTLAHVEDRDELAVFEDLKSSSADATQTLPVSSVTQAAHQKIRRWLAEENLQVQDVPDPDGIFY